MYSFSPPSFHHSSCGLTRQPGPLCQATQSALFQSSWTRGTLLLTSLSAAHADSSSNPPFLNTRVRQCSERDLTWAVGKISEIPSVSCGSLSWYLHPPVLLPLPACVTLLAQDPALSWPTPSTTFSSELKDLITSQKLLDLLLRITEAHYNFNRFLTMSSYPLSMFRIDLYFYQQLCTKHQHFLRLSVPVFLQLLIKFLCQVPISCSTSFLGFFNMEVIQDTSFTVVWSSTAEQWIPSVLLSSGAHEPSKTHLQENIKKNNAVLHHFPL